MLSKGNDKFEKSKWEIFSNFVAFSQNHNIFIYLSELALLHSHARDSLNVLLSQMSLAILLALCQGHVERFGHNNTSIHLSHGLGGLLGAGEADKSESFAATLFVHHLKVWANY